MHGAQPATSGIFIACHALSMQQLEAWHPFSLVARPIARAGTCDLEHSRGGKRAEHMSLEHAFYRAQLVGGHARLSSSWRCQAIVSKAFDWAAHVPLCKHLAVLDLRLFTHLHFHEQKGSRSVRERQKNTRSLVRHEGRLTGTRPGPNCIHQAHFDHG
jgi:hypothetical protein